MTLAEHRIEANLKALAHIVSNLEALAMETQCDELTRAAILAMRSVEVLQNVRLTAAQEVYA